MSVKCPRTTSRHTTNPYSLRISQDGQEESVKVSKYPRIPRFPISLANEIIRNSLGWLHVLENQIHQIPGLKELVKDVDTVTFCLSKGLSAPVGSLLCGTAEAIDRARRVRKMLGAGMRQVGVIAAAGIVAMETMVERLAEDHLNAQRLADGLARIPGIIIEQNRVQTNLVFFKANVRSQNKVVCRLNEGGVKVLGNRPTWRFVTHYGITSADIDYALDVIDSVFREFAA